MYEKKRCDACAGKGWVVPKRKRTDQIVGQWPVYCGTCGGSGGFTMRRLAELLGEDVRSLARVDDVRSRPDTCLRVFRKIVGHFANSAVLA